MDKLIELLEHNAMADPEHLGKLLGKSEAEIRQQIRDYHQKGIIRGYRAILSDEAKSEFVRAVIEVKVSPEREGGFDRTAERISKFDEVTSCFLMSGGFDLLIFVEGKTLQQVASFVASKLSALERVSSTATHFMLKTYKDHGILTSQSVREERISVSP